MNINALESKGKFPGAMVSSFLRLLRTGTFPGDPLVGNKMQKQSLRYTLLDKVFYRRYFQGLVLRCMTREVGLMVLEEVWECREEIGTWEDPTPSPDVAEENLQRNFGRRSGLVMCRSQSRCGLI
ncbi:hypothetical protein LIER_26729 [Lithospermum erythrorhizon]|uniref:Uncharacterized protein n=1 Tax=Lithospermum erythrorhizon TaxID=34254 RepID=A0AAV3RDN3_LITER